MKVPKIRGYDLSFSSSVRSGVTERYYVTLWRQSVHHWLAAAIYHHYDSICWRLPGFRALERWLQRRHSGDELYVPLSNRQDLRCDYLKHRRREELTLEVTAAEYAKLRKNTPV